MSETYEGRQIVGMDLHRRCSVLVRMTEAEETLEAVRISNDVECLRHVVASAGERPEVAWRAAQLVSHKRPFLEHSLGLTADECFSLKGLFQNPSHNLCFAS